MAYEEPQGLDEIWNELNAKYAGTSNNEEEVEVIADEDEESDDSLSDEHLTEDDEEVVVADENDSDEEVTDSPDENTEETDSEDSVKPEGIIEVKANGRIEKVDLSDTEKVSTLLSKAFGADKAFREKAKLAKDYEALKAEAEEATNTVNTLKRVVNDEGIDGLLKLLLNDEEAADKYFKHKLDLYEASPEERERKEAVEKVRRLEKKMEREEAERKEREKKAKELAEHEATAQFKLRASDVYHSTKLEGDTKTVKMLNTQIWNEAIRELDSKHGSDGMLKASKREIEAVFKQISQEVKSEYRSTQKKAKAQAIGKAKQKAAKSVAADVRGGVKGSKGKDAHVQEIRDAEDEASLANAFKKFFGG